MSSPRPEGSTCSTAGKGVSLWGRTAADAQGKAVSLPPSHCSGHHGSNRAFVCVVSVSASASASASACVSCLCVSCPVVCVCVLACWFCCAPVCLFSCRGGERDREGPLTGHGEGATAGRVREAMFSFCSAPPGAMSCVCVSCPVACVRVAVVCEGAAHVSAVRLCVGSHDGSAPFGAGDAAGGRRPARAAGARVGGPVRARRL